MAWITPNKRRHLATQEAIRGIVARLCDLETAPVPALDIEQLRQNLASLHTELGNHRERLVDAEDGVDKLASQAKDFVIALADGIQHVDRVERRIKTTVARARKKLAEHGFDDANLEAEADDLRELDGDGGEEAGVLKLPGPVAEPEEEASSIRGVSIETLRRARGW